MSLLDRVRTSGTCPPALIVEENSADGFDEEMLRVLDGNGAFDVLVLYLPGLLSSFLTILLVATDFHLSKDAVDQFLSLCQVSWRSR